MESAHKVELHEALKRDWGKWYVLEDNPINYKIKAVFEVIMESIEGGSDE